VTEANAETLAKIAPRMQAAQNIWFASVRPDGRPHLVPIWFVWHEGKVWISTGAGSRKDKNIQQNPHVSVSLEGGTNPVVIEGLARQENDPAIRDQLAPVFMHKYEWDFRTDDEYGMLISVTPTKILFGA
jgi:PPOX class probable F420-dependent enzyme